MSAAPYMPLWVADFLAKTTQLDGRETGAYMLLLMALWTHDGRLPNDPKKLQRIARCGREWPTIWGAIAPYFTVEDGHVSQGRLTEELQKVAAKREVMAHNGARGGRAKTLKNNNQHVANATVLPQQPEPESDIREEEAKASLSSGDEAKARREAEIDEAVSAFNDAARLAGWPSVKVLSKARRSAMAQRLRECGGIDGWRSAMARARASPHLTGQNDRGWVASFDFLTNQRSFAKLMEGNYDPRDCHRDQPAHRPAHRVDPALEQIARLAGLH